MNNGPGQDAIIAVQEERARIGGVEVARTTIIAATDEGVVAVQVNTVEPAGGYRPALPGIGPALQGGRPALPSSPHTRYPTQVINENRSCTDYCCLACDSEYKWYKLEGKGCFWVIVLLLLYLILGVILLPFMIFVFVCFCIGSLLGCFGDDADNNS